MITAAASFGIDNLIVVVVGTVMVVVGLVGLALDVLFAFTQPERYFHSLREAVIEVIANSLVGAGSVINTVEFIVARDWSQVPFSVGLLLLAVYRTNGWWRKRKQKIKKALGAKSKALRDKLVRTLKERIRRKQALRPVPNTH